MARGLIGRLSLVLATAVFGIVIGLGGLIAPRLAGALSSNDFQAGRIIDDFTFFNSNTMSADDIQKFLNARVPTCDTNGDQIYSGSTTRATYGTSQGYPPPYTCIKDYTIAVPSVVADTYCASITGGTKSAAMIIKEVSTACSVNPQSMIVLLQKEQGLVSDDWPWPVQYQKATGYGCPDTAACDVSVSGFFNQIYYAARQFQKYAKQTPNPFNYKMGATSFVAYSPTASCGGTNITFQNQATAGLYNYTPYQPNAGALAGLTTSTPGGTANCGAYGNRNFWWYFNTWFGSVYANDTFIPHPNGTLVALNGKVYLISGDNSGNQVKQWITNGDVFSSYGYAWFQIKPGSAGDANLTAGADINTLAPGTIFRSDNSPVYVMTYENAVLVKQQISAAAFDSLGYNWNEVVYVSPGNVPATSASTTPILFATQHPTGTLVAGNGKAYLLDYDKTLNKEVKRWIINPDSFNTNNFDWNKVKTATTQDLALTDGTGVDLRQGNMLISNGSIYLVDYDSTGITKRPVGPWECFADRWHYAYRDLYQTVALPDRTGPIATC